MFFKFTMILSMIFLYSTNLLAEYEHMESFKATKSVVGIRSVDNTAVLKDDFEALDCGLYTQTDEGLQVNGTSYRYGNLLVTKKLYDLRDSVTKMRWKANSSSYSLFSPEIVNIASSSMTTNHSWAGSTTIA